MGSSSGFLLILGIWLLPALYVGTRGPAMPDRFGWTLLAAMTGPLGLAVFLVVRAFRPAE